MQKHKIKLIVLNISIFVSVFALIMIFNTNRTFADQPHWDETNITGWNWSGIATENATIGLPEYTHIGWFSNNCYNFFSGVMNSHCQADYGVQLDPETGNLSGYSWNGILDDSGAVTGVGWLDFDPQPFPGPPYYDARVEPVGSPYEGQISGWARVLSIQQAGEELGYEDWGWILMGPEPNTNRQFGVEVDFNSNKVTGKAWAGGYLANDQLPPNPYENVTTGLGWISFDEGTNPDYNNVTGEVEGFAWIGNDDNVGTNFDTNIGWVALNCKNAGSSANDICATSDFRMSLDSSTGNVSGYAWIGEGGLTNDPIGWIDFDPNPFPSEPNYSAKVYLEDTTAQSDSYGTYGVGDVVGWARLVSLQKEGAKGHFENWGWVKMNSTDTEGPVPPTHFYGVSLDINTGEFDGYAWSGGGTVCVGLSCYNNSVGLGWIDFNDSSGNLSPTYVAPFLETVQGDIYSTTSVGAGNIFTLPRATSEITNRDFYNSTFLIQTGGTITRYVSELGETDSDYYIENYEEIPPPLATNKYSNVLGKLDVDGITSYEAVEDPPVEKNKFGTIVETYNNNISLSQGLYETRLSHLEGKAYHVGGDLTIDIPMEIANGEVVNNEIAAGTIVIDGDLIIEENITYEPLDVSDTEIDDIPSVVWIVKGSVYISSDVTDVVGSFVVVGDELSGALVDGTGDFYTGGGDENLEIRGLVVAHELFLQRTGIGTVENIEAAESIFYDGRIIINTPPGVGDFAGALPVVREVAPIEVNE